MEVVNIYKDKNAIYGGRGKRGTIPPYPTYGWLGNPFPVEDFGLEMCLHLYEAYFLKRVEVDENFRLAVIGLKGKTVGCFCKPKPCHLDIVAKWVNHEVILN